MELVGRTAVITGAASGIGQALAVEAAARGVRVVAADLNEPTETVETIRSAGGETEPFVCDIADPASVDDLARQSEEIFGLVSMVFANAGGGRASALEECSDDDFAYVMGVNLFGTFHTLRAFYPLLRRAATANGSASLCITGSEHSLGIPPNQVLGAYTVSKHALLGLADVARHNLSGYGVAVTLLCPGWTLSPAVVGYLDAYPESAPPIRAVAQTPKQVAVCGLDAVERGTFLAPTNVSSREAAVLRIDEIRAAFDRLDKATL